VHLFPQGNIESQAMPAIRFEQGVRRILDQFPEQAALYYAVCRTEYFSHRRPTLHVFVAREENTVNATDAEKNFNRLYQNCQAEIQKLHFT
jgi:hypothetical protein